MAVAHSRWVVEAYTGGGGPGGPNESWEGIRAPDAPFWNAIDAADAFKRAVLDNQFEQLRSTSYRVLPFDGGATFNVGVNVDAVGHEQPAS